jgi:hypothetical protein
LDVIGETELKAKFFIIGAAFGASTLLSFQNCAKEDQIAKMLSKDLSSTTVSSQETTTTVRTNTTLPGGSLDPALDPQCMTNPGYDACIFYKNPVAQRGAPFNPATNYSSNMSAIQIYGVNLNTATLSTPSFRISMDGGRSVATRNPSGNWKFTYASDANHRVAQVMTFYWMREQQEVMKEISGRWYAEGKNVNAVAFTSTDGGANNNAYFSPVQNRIVMGFFNDAGIYTGGEIEAALSADVTMHEMGHANWHHSNTARLGNEGALHVTCGNNNLCCTTNLGCTRAANEGQADIHAFLMFPDLPPATGESANNSLTGLVSCNIPRNPLLNSDASPLRTNETFYNACPQGSRGAIHVMGSLYATIWYDIITDPGVQDRDEIAKIFTEHLPLIMNNHDFVDLGTLIVSVAETFYPGKYANIIRAAFALRGLPLP